MAREFVKVLRKEFQHQVKLGNIRYESCCAKCGRTSDEVLQLELHHIVSLNQCPPERGYEPNVQENIITLCFDCHLAYHRCFEDEYPEDSILNWLDQIPMEVVNQRLAKYRSEREERRRFHMNKHRKTE